MAAKEAKDGFLKTNQGYIREYIKDGKRLRPILLIMAYKAFCDNDKIIPASLSVELLHNSTLIHDDIMDEDDFRRAKPTVYKRLKDSYLADHKEDSYDGPLFNKSSSKFAVSNAILCGNILIPLGADMISNSDFPDELKNNALKIYNNAYRLVNYGQFLDILLEKRKDVKEKEYLDMIEKKTACLFSASVAIGAVLADAKPEKIKQLEEYAKELAIAFQLVDDIMDISEDMAKGHELGSDIKRGKKTLLVIKALENGTGKERKELLSILGTSASKEEIIRAIGIIKKNSLAYVRSEADKRVIKAKEILNKMGINKESRDFFNEFADYMALRKR